MLFCGPHPAESAHPSTYNGAMLRAFSSAIIETCWKAANELHDEIAKTIASFKKVYESMQA
jgi:TRAP-type mannitol/chloroaromatic compound transport system substrate-binding protein